MEFFEQYTGLECIIRGEELKKIGKFCEQSDCVMIVAKSGLMVINNYKDKALYTKNVQTSIKKFIAFRSHFLSDVLAENLNDREFYVIVFDKEPGHAVVETISGKLVTFISGKLFSPPC